ncbi:hypothetical protein OROMI_033943 [Orobanche minor]
MIFSHYTHHQQSVPNKIQRLHKGSYLRTHDFLQPLERVGRNTDVTKEENKAIMSGVERPPVVVPPASMDYLLPGGIGTYNISYFNKMVLNPEGSLFTAQATSTSRNDEDSKSCTHTISGFTLWDESAVKKGKTGKENITAQTHIMQGLISSRSRCECGGRAIDTVPGKAVTVIFYPQAFHGNLQLFLVLSPSSSQKNQTFMEMITSAKNDQEEDYEDNEFAIKKDHSSHSKDNFSVKVEAKIADQKPNTPRSKHSATEQRRRCKINDRFQKLREIIPNSDQKRDKASFLLEVINYIQFLQEKVNRYESSYNVWNHEPSEMMQWKNSQIAEGFSDHTQTPGGNTNSGRVSAFARKFEENRGGVSPSRPINGQNVVDSDISTATTIKQRGQLPELMHNGTARTAATSPVSPKQQSTDTNIKMTWPPSMKDQELTVESGTINISSVYSQGLLNTLTQALQTFGADLSQASISVQFDLGKRANCVQHASTLPAKDDDVPAALPRSRSASAGDEFGHALKRQRTS